MEKIKYKDVINLGFEIEGCSDHVYFNEHGYQYEIITKELTDLIQIQWHKETKDCIITRHDKDYNVLNSRQIISLEDLKNTIDFFCNEKTEDSNEFNPYLYA